MVYCIGTLLWWAEGAFGGADDCGADTADFEGADTFFDDKLHVFTLRNGYLRLKSVLNQWGNRTFHSGNRMLKNRKWKINRKLRDHGP